ncbi:hypothetical protein NS376_01795 [Pseudomonas oryzihabitans]|nr:hypothetical protein NS376_01795 [Pseudomonas psychrotolerans]
MDSSPSLVNASRYPLSAAFASAWSEWMDARERLNALDSVAAQATFATEQGCAITHRLWQRVAQLAGDARIEQAKAVLYTFVALLDEQLLFQPWAGQADWNERLLEARLFKSHAAGERVPLAISRLLAAKDPGDRDLANVYLQCLILGFYGRLRGKKGAALHEQWRKALFEFVHQRPASVEGLGSTLGRLANETTPLQQPPKESLPDSLRLGMVLGGVFMLLLVVSLVLWWDIGRPLNTVLAELNNAQQEQEF